VKRWKKKGERAIYRTHIASDVVALTLMLVLSKAFLATGFWWTINSAPVFAANAIRFSATVKNHLAK
jgi:hypothetical protein